MLLSKGQIVLTDKNVLKILNKLIENAFGIPDLNRQSISLQKM